MYAFVCMNDIHVTYAFEAQEILSTYRTAECEKA